MNQTPQIMYTAPRECRVWCRVWCREQKVNALWLAFGVVAAAYAIGLGAGYLMGILKV